MQLFGLIGADTALKELLKIGVNQIQWELQQRTQLIVSKLKDRHIQTLIPYTPEHMAGIISFLVPGNNEALYDALVAEDIWITYRNNIFRLSPHYDTPLADIKRFFEVLDQFL